MGLQPSNDLPEFPKLRAVEPQWVEHEGQSYLFLRDPLGLADNYVLVPQTLAPLLALCDGSRDLAALGPAYSLRVGFKIPVERIRDIVAQLDEVQTGQDMPPDRPGEITLEGQQRLRHPGAHVVPLDVPGYMPEVGQQHPLASVTLEDALVDLLTKRRELVVGRMPDRVRMGSDESGIRLLQDGLDVTLVPRDTDHLGPIGPEQDGRRHKQQG